MALAPKKPLPQWLANVKQPSLRLHFWPLSGTFVTDHKSNTAVSVTRVIGSFGFKALIFRTRVHEDLDGAPYAPPISVTNLSPKLPQVETSIKNATNKSSTKSHPDPVFHNDPKDNTFLWTGVVSMTPGEAASTGREIDTGKYLGGGAFERDFLKDSRGRFPVMQRGGTGYYVGQTAIATRTGDAVNPLEVPYAALSTSLRDRGGVRLGDFGLAIRASTGDSSPFIYADAGGDSSTSVGEYSRKLIGDLFGGGATTEKVCYIVFPDSRRVERVAEPELMTPTVRRLIHDLDRVQYENADDLPRYLAYPATWDPHRLPRTAAERIALNSLYGPETWLIRSALTRWGFKQPSVPLNKEIF